jgi:hypothetical protein
MRPDGLAVLINSSLLCSLVEVDSVGQVAEAGNASCFHTTRNRPHASSHQLIGIWFLDIPDDTSAAPREVPDFLLNHTRNPAPGSRIRPAVPMVLARLAMTPG